MSVLLVLLDILMVSLWSTFYISMLLNLIDYIALTLASLYNEITVHGGNEWQQTELGKGKYLTVKENKE